MTITATDFEKLTGISRHTVYSWFYRSRFPEGVKAAKSLGSTKLLLVSKTYEHYDKLKKEFV